MPSDGCQIVGDEMLCDANSVYHETTDLEIAADYCQDICNEDEECSRYFFQKHQNGHEICGFYSEVVDLDDGIWHGHPEGSRVCKKELKAYIIELFPKESHLWLLFL